ncbi:HD domain-containing protein [Roseospira goensis]|uniref:5'-deoxynucleotidase n=1 Tax=Roseospira goensis TaxID=391922 RepID=A0A7W6RYY7_9PROT|nr:HD domain-containing protein [Roseospira goensis]MBB4285295.1 putative hydrolase of HD superfamily [Roseospira goensis]
MTTPESLDGVLTFIEAAGALKDTLRSGCTAGGRVESVAEHSWRLGLLALVLGRDHPELDLMRVQSLCLVHDLGEALHGDIPAIDQADDPDRTARERRDFRTLVAPLPEATRADLTALHDEYEEVASPEARFVKALDKLETLIHHTEGANGPDFDYAFNLDYGRTATDRVPRVAALRAMVDEKTRTRLRHRGDR